MEKVCTMPSVQTASTSVIYKDRIFINIKSFLYKIVGKYSNPQHFKEL